MPNDIHQPTALIIAAILWVIVAAIYLRERKLRRDQLQRSTRTD